MSVGIKGKPDLQNVFLIGSDQKLAKVSRTTEEFQPRRLIQVRVWWESGIEGEGHSETRSQDEIELLPTKLMVQFAQGPLLDGLYWTKWYNNKSLGYGSHSFIYYENMLLGVPRLRQLRVRNDSCVVHEDFREDILNCYDVYSADKEEQRPFGSLNGTA